MVEHGEEGTGIDNGRRCDDGRAADLLEFSTVLEAVMIFRDADCGAVPILEEGKPVAILTDRDVALALAEFPDLVNRPVSEIMSPGIVAVTPEDTLGQVCEVLRSQVIRRVLVVDSDGRLLGIIGWADIAPVLSDRMMGRLVTEVVVRRLVTVAGGRCGNPAASPDPIACFPGHPATRHSPISRSRPAERPLWRRMVRTQLRFRANSSGVRGNPTPSARSRTAAIAIQAPAMARATRATPSRAKPRLIPNSETSSSAIPASRSGRPALPARLRQEHGAADLERFDVLLQLDEARSAWSSARVSRFSPNSATLVTTSPGLAHSHYPPTGRRCRARSMGSRGLSPMRWSSASLDQPSQDDSRCQGGPQGQYRSVGHESLAIPRPRPGTPAPGRGSRHRCRCPRLR